MNPMVLRYHRDVVFVARRNASRRRRRGRLIDGLVARAGRPTGRYEVLGTLGAGAMGTVYRAHDPQLDREVALKVLRAPDDDSALPQRYKTRLRREARALASLDHPNVVVIYGVAEDASRLFLAMELVEGRTLRQWLDEEELALPRILEAGRRARPGCRAGSSGHHPAPRGPL